MCALPFFFLAMHVYQRLFVFRIIFVDDFTWMIEYFFAEIKLTAQLFSKHQALVAWKNDSTSWWNCIIQAPWFSIYHILRLCFESSHDALFGKLICNGALHDIKSSYAQELVRCDVIYQSIYLFNLSTRPSIYFMFLICFNTTFLSDGFSSCGINFAY